MSGAPAASAGAASPPGTHPKVAHRDSPLAGQPRALASPEHTSSPEDTAPVSLPSPQSTEAHGHQASSSRSASVSLECDFSDDAASQGPPPPLRGVGTGQEEAPEEMGDSPVPPPWGSYDLDWDKLDDPNFNPFGGGGRVQSIGHPQSKPAGPAAAEASPPSP